MLLIPVVLVIGGILALVLYLEKRSPPYRRLRRVPTSRPASRLFPFSATRTGTVRHLRYLGGPWARPGPPSSTE